ncbi:MAG TPA: enolase C-terminal domain-like protein [Candidatus Binataceae bacterium]|nr:enolase C-terminal domain-like protein [Candidatus Binataceae bacterium]
MQSKQFDPAIGKLKVSTFVVPTDFPESDGTLEWTKTTLVVVEASAANRTGLGYTYAESSTAHFIAEVLAESVQGCNAFDIPAAWATMATKIRNYGRPGVAAMAIAAVDVALWDLKARILELPLAKLLGQCRDGVPIYGSGGFTSYDDHQLAKQLSGWVEKGIPQVKMKVGREPERDPHRVDIARQAIGSDARLYVDANGAYSRKQALALAKVFSERNVNWFEEPVSSDDLEGLRLIRDRAPAGMDIAAGEYGYRLVYFRRMLEGQSVDVLQADITRCGLTGFLGAAALCEARSMPLSGHCAPSLHMQAGCAVTPMRNIEYFHDHVRIEQMLFDGVVEPRQGKLHPDLSRPGLGIELKRAEAQRFAA